MRPGYAHPDPVRCEPAAGRTVARHRSGRSGTSDKGAPGAGRLGICALDPTGHGLLIRAVVALGTDECTGAIVEPRRADGRPTV
jgi:hypothetical protein